MTRIAKGTKRNEIEKMLREAANGSEFKCGIYRVKKSAEYHYEVFRYGSYHNSQSSPEYSAWALFNAANPLY